MLFPNKVMGSGLDMDFGEAIYNPEHGAQKENLKGMVMVSSQTSIPPLGGATWFS